MKSLVLGVALACLAPVAGALEVDGAECREGAQFISNAAQSRKNGATREFFLGKLEEDLFVISSVPPPLRWFAHGEREAQFLREAVIDVFAFPREPREHAAAFLRLCLATAGLDPSEAERPDAASDQDDEGSWRERADLSAAYLAASQYAYGASERGVPARDSLETRLRTVELVLQNQDNHEHDLLDSSDYYEFQGGLSGAVELLRGQAPALYHGDHHNPEAPRVRSLGEQVARVLRSRVVNPKWIAAARRHSVTPPPSDTS